MYRAHIEIEHFFNSDFCVSLSLSLLHMLREPKLSIKLVYLSSSTRSQYLLPHATFYTSKYCWFRKQSLNSATPQSTLGKDRSYRISSAACWKASRLCSLSASLLPHSVIGSFVSLLIHSRLCSLSATGIVVAKTVFILGRTSHKHRVSFRITSPKGSMSQLINTHKIYN